MLRESRPVNAVRPWVDACWETSGTPQTIRVLPDGCADIMFDRDRDETFVVGTMTAPLVLDAARVGNYLGIRFRPGRLARLLRIPLRELTDRRVPLRDVNSRIELRAASYEHDLVRLLRESDPRVDSAVEKIIRSAGRCNIEYVAAHVNVTRQHLARLFAEEVGVSPKTFAKIVRFRFALRLGSSKPWADVAAELGYSDQSHLIADFREFSGTTPVPFFLSPDPGRA
jgi:AraC-like DNA-binding protein